MSDVSNVKSEGVDHEILRSLQSRSSITRLITVMLVSFLICAATAVSIIIVSNSDGQESIVDKLIGVKRAKLEPGDLVFFRTQNGESGKKHVGVYVGNKGEPFLPIDTSDNKEINSEPNQLLKKDSAMSALLNSFASPYRWGGSDDKITSVAASVSRVLLNLSIIIFLGFIMRAVLVFIRYYMQLGTDYENQKLAYMLSKGSTETFGNVLTTLRENKINFEKTPVPPQEKIILSALDIVKQQSKFRG